MGARMMSGHTDLHEKLENILANLVNKQSSYVLNLDIMYASTIDTLVSKNDVIVYTLIHMHVY